MDTLQKVQEVEYEFPYHHLPSFTHGFSQARLLGWGFIYASYLEHVFDRILELGSDSIIDVGCGDGKMLLEARARFPKAKLVGVDYSARAIAFAKAFAYGKDIDFETADITKETGLGTFSLLTLVEVCEHIPPNDLPGFLKGCADHVAAGGYMIITVPADITPVTHKHYQHFSRESLSAIVEPLMEIVSVEYITKKGPAQEIIRRVLSNRFFILNEKHILAWIYRYYKQHYTVAQRSNGDRIMLVARKAGIR